MYTLSDATSSAVCNRVKPEIWSVMARILGSAGVVELHRLAADKVDAGPNLTTEVRATRAQHFDASDIVGLGYGSDERRGGAGNEVSSRHWCGR
jgi:hypothetical protein